MVKVEFLGPINKESIDLDIKNLSELSNILKNDEKNYNFTILQC